MVATATRETGAGIQFLNELFAHAQPQRIAFKLWDGRRWPDERARAATFVLKHAGALYEMFGSGTEKGLAEAFLRDDFDIEGDIESAFELMDLLQARDRVGWLTSLRQLHQLRRMRAAHERES